MKKTLEKNKYMQASRDKNQI